MSEPSGLVATARELFGERDWSAAREQLRRAGAAHELAGSDLHTLAKCSWWLGELDVALPDLEQAYRRYLEQGDRLAAAMAALDLSYTNGLRGDQAQASGWIGRAFRQVDDAVGPDEDCVERGYLLYTRYEQALGAGEGAEAHALAGQVRLIGSKFNDRALVALGTLGEGRAAVTSGDLGGGLALIDEAMVAAVSDELDPAWVGNIYCNMMTVCYELADWSRASEWTAATERWCQAMPGAGPFLGICRVHRAQVLHARGDWTAAEAAARRVCEDPVEFVPAMAGEAWYARGDIHRLRGHLVEAETSYGEAHRRRRHPWPGLALLWLARGHRSAAVAGITQALAAAGGSPLARARQLPAAVEIMISAGEMERAAAAADELAALAATYPTSGFRAASGAALGAVALANREYEVAIGHLEQAVGSCQRTPYDEARAGLLLSEARKGLGHTAVAALEEAAAREKLHRLGAAVEVSAAARDQVRPAGMSAREAEVLDLLSDGLSNQQIAARLTLSVRTVERHLATVYRKLGLHGRGARTAAVRYALGERPRPPVRSGIG